MKNGTVWVRALACAGGVMVAVPASLAGFQDAQSGFQVQQRAFAEIDGGGAFVERYDDLDVQLAVHQDGQPGPYSFRDRNILDADIGSARANLVTDVWTSLSLNNAEMRFTASGQADASEADFAFADLSSRYELRVQAEADTELTVSMRLEVVDDGEAVRNAFIRLDGLSSPFELRYDGTGSFAAELELTITVAAGSTYTIEGVFDAMPESRFGGPFWGAMEVDVMLAPSPGTGAVLGLAGLVAARRRR